MVTVREELERVIGGFVQHEVKVHGSGREPGVHFRGQVAHFDAVTRMDETAILRACNGRLPGDIRVVRVAVVDLSFMQGVVRWVGVSLFCLEWVDYAAGASLCGAGGAIGVGADA